MNQITISNGTTTITMPRTKKVSDAGENEAKETKMAGGRRTQKIVGFRKAFKYSWDYVPAATIAALRAMLRPGGFYTVGYFDIDGTDGSDLFSVSYPSFEVFKYVDGVAMWHNCSITITAQEVS